MKFTGLDGKTYSLRLEDYIRHDGDSRHTSKLHQRCRRLLHRIFPLFQICEEVPLDRGLRADFLIPQKRLLVECDGRQHIQCVGFFHKDWFSYYKATSRDRDKEQWATLNKFVIVRLMYDADDEQWHEQLLST